MSRPTPLTYKTRNWASYNEALKRRGSLTIWFDPTMTWDATPTGKRGRQPVYGDAAIQTCLTMKVLFGMALRQTTGFVESLLSLIGLDWAVPDFSTLSRRQKTLKVNIPYRGSDGPLHLLVDSTGIKVEGEGEWNARKHGGTRRRVWRKIHIGIDEKSLEIRAAEFTTSDVGDAPMLPELLDQIPPEQEIASVTADGAFDTRKCHDAITQSTLEVFAKREIEAKNNIDRQTGMTSWQDGRLIFIAISPEQNKAAYEEKKRQREDVLAHCKIATAVPQTDLSGQNLKIAEMLGAAARDSVLAAEGNGLLLLSEDQGLRQWATAALEVGASWLQPVLLLAKDGGLISIEDYTKFIVDCLNRDFTYVSIDSQTLLTQAKAERFNGRGTVKRMLEVVGGKNADLETNIGVAATFLDFVFHETRQEHLRDRYASMVLEAFCAPRQDKAIEVIKALTAQVSLRVFNFIEYAFWWIVGRTVGTPNFRQQVEETKKSQLIRPVAIPPAISFRATERIRLLGSCFPT